MKSKYIFSILIASLIGWEPSTAQQVTLPFSSIAGTNYYNPAFGNTSRSHDLRLVHYQVGENVNGFGERTQYVSYRSPGLGANQRFGLGVILANDAIHSEGKFSLNGLVSAHLLLRKDYRLSVGISAGLINRSSNYDDIPQWDLNDPLTENPLSFLDLDAGAGLDFEMRKRLFKIDAGIAALQLPGNTSSKPLPAFVILPQFIATGGVLFNVRHNLMVGPRVLYHNDTPVEGRFNRRAMLDLGLKAELDRQGMWATAAYRWDSAAVALGFGIRLTKSDSMSTASRAGYALHMNAGFSYPLGDNQVIGPGIEVGLRLVFGRKERAVVVDSMRDAEPFWLNDGFLNSHKVRRLSEGAPRGLEAHTKQYGNKVLLTYSFPDNNYRYIGDAPVFADTLLEAVGTEWEGVDVIIERIASEVVREALTPDTRNIRDPENLLPLDNIASLKLSCQLRSDEVSANNGAGGVIYEGELGMDSDTTDTLHLQVVFNDADTIIRVVRNQFISNLELAALKLHCLRKRLQHELQKYYGEKMAFLWETDEPSYEVWKEIIEKGLQIVFIDKLRIIPNNPNQQAFQVNEVALEFINEGKKQMEVDEDSKSARKKKRKKKK